jgi:hypothetical protein
MADDDLDSIPEKPRKQQNSLLMPLRIVLFALLAVAIAGLIIDQIARQKANATFNAVNSALGTDGKLEVITRDEVHKIVGRAPDDDDDAGDAFETFTWQGALKPQVLYVQYRRGKEAVLKDVSLNEKPPGFPE